MKAFSKPNFLSGVFSVLVEDICRLPFLLEQLDDTPSSKQILLSYVWDQVRTFHLLEKWLHCPAELADQPVFQLTDACRAELLEK